MEAHESCLTYAFYSNHASLAALCFSWSLMIWQRHLHLTVAKRHSTCTETLQYLWLSNSISGNGNVLKRSASIVIPVQVKDVCGSIY